MNDAQTDPRAAFEAGLARLRADCQALVADTRCTISIEVEIVGAGRLVEVSVVSHPPRPLPMMRPRRRLVEQVNALYRNNPAATDVSLLFAPEQP